MASHRLHHHRVRDRRRHARVREAASQGTSDHAQGRDEAGLNHSWMDGISHLDVRPATPTAAPRDADSAAADWSNPLLRRAQAPRRVNPVPPVAPDLPASEPRRRAGAVAVSVDNSPRLVAARLGPCASSRSKALPGFDMYCRLYTSIRGNTMTEASLQRRSSSGHGSRFTVCGRGRLERP